MYAKITDEDSLQSEINSCFVCHFRYRHLKMAKPESMGRGPTSASVMIIGEEPGRKEIASNTAFSGAAGKRLKSWLETIGVGEDSFQKDFYKTSLIKCATGGNVTDSMIGECGKFLEIQISLIRPQLVIPLGWRATSVVLRGSHSLGELIGSQYDEFHFAPALFRRFPLGCKIVPLPHPSPRSRWPQNNPDRLLTALSTIKSELWRVRES